MIVVVTHRQWANLLSALGLSNAVESVETKRGVSFATDDGLRFEHRDFISQLLNLKLVLLVEIIRIAQHFLY